MLNSSTGRTGTSSDGLFDTPADRCLRHERGSTCARSSSPNVSRVVRTVTRQGRIRPLPGSVASTTPVPLVTARAPGLLAVYGVGPDTAALLLIAAGDHPERLRSEAAWAHLCAAAPIPASSGKVTRRRLNPVLPTDSRIL
jgi:hypothetical protein